MRCLSIRQPWVEMILTGEKRVEFRSRSTSVRGRILLHAGKVKAENMVATGLPRGAVVGSVEIVDCQPCTDDGYAWVLANPLRFAEPIPFKGNVGWFDVPDALLLPVQGIIAA